MKKLSTLLVAVFAVFAFTQCGDTTKKVEGAAEDAANATEEAVTEAADDAAEAAKKAADAAREAGADAMDKLDGALNFEAGSIEAGIKDFADSGSGTQVFTLDKVPFEGEEISVEANQQLDAIASILKTYPDLKAEIKCHTRGADNKLGAAAKKTASGARAIWVKQKLKARGLDGDRLEANGYGDTEPLAGVDPKDDSQNRVEIAMSK